MNVHQYFGRILLVLPLALNGACGPELDSAGTAAESSNELSFGSGAGTVIEAETFALPSSAGKVANETSASGGRALFIWSNTTATLTRATDAISLVRVRARGDQCNGAPRMSVRIDGAEVLLSEAVSSTAWQSYQSSGLQLPAGLHRIEIVYANNDVAPALCDRNLRVDRIELISNPFVGARFYVDPGSQARQQADAWRATRPLDAAQLDKIAGSPMSRWLGGWHSDITLATRQEVDRIAAAGALPVLVAYNIPYRDCGGYSGGGSAGGDAYRTWIRGVAAGIADRRAVVILEPDALSLVPCLPPAQQQERYALLREAVGILSATGNVAVYIDAGHSAWHTPQEMVARLRKSGISAARGFSLNIANFKSTRDEVAHGTAIVQALGQDKRFVIDTSRNGLGPNGEWCNPAGRALGAPATSSTSSGLVDAFFWFKTPGLSDGTCNGGPPAGTWWPEYALGLAQRAAY